MKVNVELNVAERVIPMGEMEKNGLTIGIVTSTPDWAGPDVGMPVFCVRSDMYYFPYDDTWIDTDNDGFFVRPLRDGERVVIEN